MLQEQERQFFLRFYPTDSRLIELESSSLVNHAIADRNNKPNLFDLFVIKLNY